MPDDLRRYGNSQPHSPKHGRCPAGIRRTPSGWEPSEISIVPTSLPTTAALRLPVTPVHSAHTKLSLELHPKKLGTRSVPARRSRHTVQTHTACQTTIRRKINLEHPKSHPPGPTTAFSPPVGRRTIEARRDCDNSTMSSSKKVLSCSAAILMLKTMMARQSWDSSCGREVWDGQ